MDYDKIINEFSKNVDNDLKLQEDINLFARQICSKLFTRVNEAEAVLGSFYDKNLAFTVFCSRSSSGTQYYTVRLMDVEEYQKYFKLGTPEYTKSIRADFEHDPDYVFTEELHKVIVMLLFRKFNIEIKPEEED